MRGDELWEQHAGWWQQVFTEGTDPEYEEQILPLAEEGLRGARRVLDVGCGEGQVCRRIGRLGGGVVGVDPTKSQIIAAHRRGGPARFVRAPAASLPFAEATFDAVVVCLALEHVDPFEPALHEVARVLEPGGRFLLFLVHPFLQAPGSGWVVDELGGEQFWRIGDYLDDHVEIDDVAPGVQFSFAHRPLGRYVHVMGEAGLLIEDMVEPSPPAIVVEETCGSPQGASIPRLLLLRARRIDPGR